MSKKQNNEKTECGLMDLAHQGTKEAIDKITKIIKKSKDSNLVGLAQCALDECYFIYLLPETDEEERDFLLAKMITQKEGRMVDLEIKIDQLQGKLKRHVLKHEVHQNVIQDKDTTEEQKQNWRYQIYEDLYSFEQRRINEYQDNIEYEKAWIRKAQDMIQDEKYKDVPYGMLESIHSFDESNDLDDDLFCL